MSETIFSRVLAAIQAAGPQGIRTDDLARATGGTHLCINNYIKRHRQAGAEIHTLLGVHAPALVYARADWFEAARAKKAEEVKARLKGRERKRSEWKSELAAIRRANAQADAARRAAIIKPPKPPKPAKSAKSAKPATFEKPAKSAGKFAAKTPPFWTQECTGPMPEPHVLPSSPVYSRHQIASLPAGFTSMLNPAECRPWAMAARP